MFFLINLMNSFVENKSENYDEKKEIKDIFFSSVGNTRNKSEIESCVIFSS